MEYERAMAAFDGNTIVGINGVSTFQMTVPGAIVPTGGVATVATLPTHRRRGVMTALMGRQLDDIHERGEPLAALWASEAVIYGRFGFGSATVACSFDIQRHHTAFAVPFHPEGRVRIVDLDEAGRVDHLSLRPLPRVDQDPAASGADQQAGSRPPRRGHGAAGA